MKSEFSTIPNFRHYIFSLLLSGARRNTIQTLCFFASVFKMEKLSSA